MGEVFKVTLTAVVPGSTPANGFSVPVVRKWPRAAAGANRILSACGKEMAQGSRAPPTVPDPAPHLCPAPLPPSTPAALPCPSPSPLTPHLPQVFDSSRLSFIQAAPSVLWSNMFTTMVPGSGTSTLYLTCLTTTTSENMCGQAGEGGGDVMAIEEGGQKEEACRRGGLWICQ